MKNNRFNSISIVPVRSLEVGDLIAMEFLRRVISGKITGIVYAKYQLTEDQLAYMKENDLTIPDNEYTPMGGDPSSCLIFGEFAGHSDHMYISFDMNVAVFHPQPRPGSEEHE